MDQQIGREKLKKTNRQRVAESEKMKAVHPPHVPTAAMKLVCRSYKTTYEVGLGMQASYPAGNGGQWAPMEGEW